MSTSRPMLTQREAATACGVSRTTIRRRREAGLLPGAVEDPERGWFIPVEDLLAAGFRLNAPAAPDASETPGTPAAADDVTIAELRSELERVRQAHALELAEARHGKKLAESEAAHLRDQLAHRSEHIADLQQALRALMLAPERAAIPQPAPWSEDAPSAVADPEAEGNSGDRRRWWGSRP